MAITNHERVGKALDLLKEGLQPFVEREMKAQHAQMWLEQARAAVAETQSHLFTGNGKPQWDAASLLAVMWNQWNLVFRKTLGQSERTLVSELRDVRNRWAHQKPFSTRDAQRALDSMARLLTSVSAPQADEVDKLYNELTRVRFDEELRTEKRKTAGSAIESQVTGALKPWREVINPHKDVASGRYQQAEFAADLWQVYIGEGSDEYRSPEEFFRRTYLTQSLRQLLIGAVQRLGGQGSDPVVQLQTNFGGGKTHSMLALYHLFSSTPQGSLAGIDEVLQAAGISRPPKVNRVVVVGNKISPGNPVTKADGTVVRTLWGELAWQLGYAAGGVKEAAKAFKRVKADDEKATSPGDALRELMNQYGPCLILIDEWVAYARQLHDQSDLPGGSFETHFTFAQALTESAKGAKQCLLVISLPASDTKGSPHAVADDVEVGGERGRAALDRLRNAVGRVEASWRAASAEESFEIVRRRLFEPLVDRDQFVARDAIARAFTDFYRSQKQEFPPECGESDYEVRIKAAYPIHPEIFNRLYTDWSTLLKFQRTRGVLRLMAAVIHCLYDKGDRNPLILPDIEWQAFPLSGEGPLAFRASKKLRGDELLITSFAGTRLRMELDRVLWRGDYVAVKQLVEDFARYLYLPRLADSQVLLASVADGIALLTWERDSFAYADTYDDAAKRYRGLRAPAHVLVDGTSGLLVKPTVARKQMDADAGAATAATASAAPTGGPAAATTASAAGSGAATAAAATAAPALPKRFHGSATLDPTRVGRDAGRIADEVVAHLAGLMGSRVTVTLEIQAEVASGVPEKVVRTVTENCRTLKFNDQGFEES